MSEKNSPVFERTIGRQYQWKTKNQLEIFWNARVKYNHWNSCFLRGKKKKKDRKNSYSLLFGFTVLSSKHFSFLDWGGHHFNELASKDSSCRLNVRGERLLEDYKLTLFHNALLLQWSMSNLVFEETKWKATPPPILIANTETHKYPQTNNKTDCSAEKPAELSSLSSLPSPWQLVTTHRRARTMSEHTTCYTRVLSSVITLHRHKNLDDCGSDCPELPRAKQLLLFRLFLVDQVAVNFTFGIDLWRQSARSEVTKSSIDKSTYQRKGRAAMLKDDNNNHGNITHFGHCFQRTARPKRQNSWWNQQNQSFPGSSD